MYLGAVLGTAFGRAATAAEAPPLRKSLPPATSTTTRIMGLLSAVLAPGFLGTVTSLLLGAGSRLLLGAGSRLLLGACAGVMLGFGSRSRFALGAPARFIFGLST